ncbi:dihydrofolate reductase [Sorochytrium milnesiophthora]
MTGSPMKPVAMLAAACKSGGIGKSGDLPWRLKREMKYFQHVSTNVDLTAQRPEDRIFEPTDAVMNAVVMGRKTWESMPPKWRPLAGRLNVVLTRDADYTNQIMPMRSVNDGAIANPLVFTTLEAALQELNDMACVRSIFIIGGGDIYRRGLDVPACMQVFLTQIEQDFDCDSFFPDLGPTDFAQSDTNRLREVLGDPALEVDHAENGCTYQFRLYERS